MKDLAAGGLTTISRINLAKLSTAPRLLFLKIWKSSTSQPGRSLSLSGQVPIKSYWREEQQVAATLDSVTVLEDPLIEINVSYYFYI